MKFSLDNTGLELEFTLLKAGIKIMEMAREDIELEFPDLRKKTVEEVFEISFFENRLTVKEKIFQKLAIPVSLLENSLKTDVILKIPLNTILKGFITTVSGNLKAGHLDFSGRIKSISGNITIDDLRTDFLKLSSVSGNTKLNNMQGRLKGSTISGDLTVDQGNIRGLSYRTVSGDIVITSVLDLDSESNLNTVSGNINLKILRYDGDRHINISTLNGDTEVTGDYPDDKVQVKRKMPYLRNIPFKDFSQPWRSMMKDVFSNIFSGDIKPDVEVYSQSSQEENKNVETILEMLSQGKITPDQAERLMNALKGK